MTPIASDRAPHTRPSTLRLWLVVSSLFCWLDVLCRRARVCWCAVIVTVSVSGAHSLDSTNSTRERETTHHTNGKVGWEGNHSSGDWGKMDGMGVVRGLLSLWLPCVCVCCICVTRYLPLSPHCVPHSCRSTPPLPPAPSFPCPVLCPPRSFRHDSSRVG